MTKRKVLGYDNYFITENGKVFSGNIELKQYEHMGYLYVWLYKNGKRKKFFIHRLVAMAFILNPNNYPFVNHKDENVKNNNANNLEWCTAKYNTNYGTCIQRRSMSCKKKILQIDNNGEIVNVFSGIKDAAIFLSIDASSISKVASGKRKSAGGDSWKYEC